MSRAAAMGASLRRWLGISGRVDAEEVAGVMGLTVYRRPMLAVQEVKLGDSVAISSCIDDRTARWALAHAVGHHLLHPGNHLFLRDQTQLGGKIERQAEDFAWGLLVDLEEARVAGLQYVADIASRFGVPGALVWRHWETDVTLKPSS